MTLQEFSRDIVPIVQLVLSSTAVGGLLLVWYQIRLTNTWNKANSQHMMLSDLPNEDQEMRFWSAYTKYAKSMNSPITNDQSQSVYLCNEDWMCFKTFLNKHEYLCVAINAKAIDEDYAFAMHSARVVHIFNKLEAYIKFTREKYDDSEIYLDLEKVATRWFARTIATEQLNKETIHRLQQQRGTKAILP